MNIEIFGELYITLNNEVIPLADDVYEEFFTYRSIDKIETYLGDFPSVIVLYSDSDTGRKTRFDL